MQNRVKQVIESKAFTSSRFADHIGVPRATISHILSGRNKPSLEVVQKILDAFPDISAEWLVKGQGNPGRSAPSLFESHEYNENVGAIQDSREIKEETKANPGENVRISEEPVYKKDFPPADNKETQALNEKNMSQHASSSMQSHKDKKSVKIIIVYADGSYSEHSPSS